ncbi:MAG: urease accessory protein UreE [Actinomycetia bacterium]|nr:urease accessory protein UreE [Actinomycetes bacterium]
MAAAGQWEPRSAVGLEVLRLTREEALRPFGRFCTDRGTVVQLALPRGMVLNDGDLLWRDAERVIAVAVALPAVVRITVPATLPPTARLIRAMELAHFLGNQHLAVRVDAEGRLRVPVAAPEALVAWLRQSGFGDVDAAVVPGEPADPLPNPHAHQGGA